ncbi:hypothetical protein AU193_15775 [Mycobacterium sp. GA-1285]|nr:hypothetical protein AU193_15775 [Mycobacterium sp. GA-1285]
MTSRESSWLVLGASEKSGVLTVFDSVRTRQLIAIAVVLVILAAALIVFGMVLYGNGVGAVPDEVGRDPAATRKGLARVSWRNLFARTKTSAKEMLNEETGRPERLTATGAFCVMVGLIALLLALLAFVAAMV